MIILSIIKQSTNDTPQVIQLLVVKSHILVYSWH